MKQVLASRKFWAALVALLYSFLSALAPNFPISEELAVNIVTVLAAYILGVALEDGLRGSNPTPKRPAAKKSPEA